MSSAPVQAVVPELSKERVAELVALLARVVEYAGYEPLVSNVWLLGDATHFPDKWKGGEASFVRLARRVMQYAGLGPDRLSVEFIDAQEVKGSDFPLVLGNPLAVWFARAEGSHFILRADRRVLSDASLALWCLLRAVSHLFCEVYELTSGWKNADNPIIDVAAHYLGFGIVATNAAFRPQPSRGGGVSKVVKLGALTLDEQVALLQLTGMVRGVSAAGMKITRGHLGHEQQLTFDKQSPAQFGVSRSSLLTDLALPAARLWPPPHQVASVLAPLPAEQESDDAKDEKSIVGKNRDRVVFRVRRRMTFRAVQFGMGLSMAVGMLMRMDQDLKVDANMVGSVTVLGLLAVAGLGWILKENRCSDKECDARLRVEDSTCPRCAGTIAGVLSHPRERLAAEERYYAAQRSAQDPELSITRRQAAGGNVGQAGSVLATSGTVRADS